MSEQPRCTCPCIDCIEGNHCGGQYWWPDENGEEQLIGECEYIVLDDLLDDRWCDDEYLEDE